MNTLEDAYINIAKEEEKLLENLKEHGIQRQSILELKRAQEAQPRKSTTTKRHTLSSQPSNG